jgi:putative oxidoreductase
MSATFPDILALTGRILLSAIFLLSGVHKITNWSGAAEHMAAQGMTAIPFFLAMAALIELAAGLGLLLGCGTRWSAGALFLFLIPATLVFHDFWTFEGQERQTQMIQFMKNLAIMGGLLGYAAVGAGALSIDRFLSRETRFRPWRTAQRPAL